MKTHYRNFKELTFLIMKAFSFHISGKIRVIAGIFIFLQISVNGFAQEYASGVEKTALKNVNKEKQLKSTKSVWDVLFSWTLPSQYNYEIGVETDGTYIYTARYNSTKFYKYTMTGAILDSFTISGVSSIRDMAYDGTYFYGGSNSAAIYQMDFTNHTLISTINCPSGTMVRGIAYDPVNDAFWVNGWNAGNRDFKLINRSGQLIRSIPAATHGLTAVFGTAYDGWTPGGPYLWAFDQGQAAVKPKIYQVNIATGQQTGVSHDCLFDVASGIANPGAGGLFTYHDNVTGITTLGGSIQLVRIFGYDLSTCINPATDVGVIAVTGPVTNCGLSNSEPITIKVKNYGSSPVTGLQVSYELAIFQTDTETISQTIQPGDTADFTFTKQGDFTNLGGYWLSVYTILPGDESPVNDTLIDYIYHLVPENTPYSMGFGSTDYLKGWTILDENNDGLKWHYYDYEGHNAAGCAVYNYSVTNQADDWLISTCVDLNQGQNYKIDFYYKVAMATYHESLALYYGDFPDAASMTTLLKDMPSFNNETFQLSSTTFTVPVSGSYYFGWHAYSAPNMFSIYIDDINISAANGLENITDKDKVNVYLLQGSSLHVESDRLVSSVKIWNATGQMVYSENEDFVTKDINVSGYSAGIYMIQLKTAKGMISKKIIM